jgi:lactate permease
VVFAEGTGASQQVLQQGGFASVGAYVAQIGVWAALIHAIVGIAIPFIGVAMMTRFFGEERSIKPALEVLPLTLFAWASFAVPYVATAYFLGPTFPALLGAMVGLLVVTTTLRAERELLRPTAAPHRSRSLTRRICRWVWPGCRTSSSPHCSS